MKPNRLRIFSGALISLALAQAPVEEDVALKAKTLNLGLPVTKLLAIPGASESYSQRFESGIVLWLSKRGAVAVYGDIAAEWNKAGAWGFFGFPIADEAACANDTALRYQLFDKGALLWEAKTRKVARFSSRAQFESSGICRLQPIGPPVDVLTTLPQSTSVPASLAAPAVMASKAGTPNSAPLAESQASAISTVHSSTIEVARIAPTKLAKQGIGEIVGRLRVPSGPIAIAVANNFAYIGTSGRDCACLHVVDIHDPRGPLLTSSLRLHADRTDMGVTAISVVGGYAYIALLTPEETIRLAIVDVQDSARPQLITNTVVPGGTGDDPLLSIPVLGQYLYFGRVIIDVAVPRSPNVVSGIETAAHFATVHEVNHGDPLPVQFQEHATYLYIAEVFLHSYEHSLVTWDVSDARHPRRHWTTRLTSPRNGALMEVKQLGDKLYVTEEGGGLYALSADSRPAVQGRISGLTYFPRIIGTDPSGFLYIKDQQCDLFQRVNVQDAYHLSVEDIGESGDLCGVTSFGAVSGAYAYIVTPSRDELRVIRIQ